MLERVLPSTRTHYPTVSLHQSNASPAVQEYQPVVHRLRRYRPRLRSRLTLGGRAFPGKPQTFDGEDSHLTLATYASILTCMSSTAPYGTASVNMQRSSTARIPKEYAPMASATGFSPGHFRRTTTRLVSCYALFK